MKLILNRWIRNVYCPVCRNHSRAMCATCLRQRAAGWPFGSNAQSVFYNTLMERIRDALDAGEFAQFRKDYSERLAQRI